MTKLALIYCGVHSNHHAWDVKRRDATMFFLWADFCRVDSEVELHGQELECLKQLVQSRCFTEILDFHPACDASLFGKKEGVPEACTLPKPKMPAGARSIEVS